jgi:hypothetical protein
MAAKRSASGGVQGDAEHTDVSDGRTQYRARLRRAVSHAGGRGSAHGPVPVQRRWGDIITGVVAVPVLWLLKDWGARHTTAIAPWNLFGAADLVLAIA